MPAIRSREKRPHAATLVTVPILRKRSIKRGGEQAVNKHSTADKQSIFLHLFTLLSAFSRAMAGNEMQPPTPQGGFPLPAQLCVAISRLRTIPAPLSVSVGGV